MHRALATAAFLSVTGCASVTGSKLQSVTVQSMHDSQEILGTGCTLSNDAGKWIVTTPGAVMIAKSTESLAVECKKNPDLLGKITVPSKANTHVWGNLLLGGPVGYVIDRNTGAGFDYPSTITIILDKAVDALILQPEINKSVEPPAPAPVIEKPAERPVEVLAAPPPPPKPVPPPFKPADLPDPKPHPSTIPHRKASSYWE